MTTLFVTLATDLLVGVGVGIALKLVLHWWRGVPLSSLLRTRAAASRTDDDIRIKMYGAAIFTSLLPLRRSLGDVAADVSRVVIDLRGVAVVDHTFLSRVEAMSREWPQAELAFEGLEDLLPVSKHPLATRRRKRA